MPRELRIHYEGAIYHLMSRRWGLGDDTSRLELLAQAHEREGEHHYGSQRRETAEQKAGRIVAEEVDARGWSEAELTRRRKGDAKKVGIGSTTAPRDERDAEVDRGPARMGSWRHVSNLLSAARKKKCKK